MLKADSKLKATISVHTATAGNDKSLSENRTDAIKSYLMSQGVRESQLETIGYGGEQPIRSGKNQRIEIKLHY